MTKIIQWIAVVALCCGAQNLAAADPQAADKLAIHAIDEEYIRAFNAKDARMAVQTFADDVVYETDDGRTLRGKEEIQRALQAQFEDLDNATLNLKVYSVEIAPDGQRATERGVSVVSRDGIDEPSSYVAEFSKQGGQWRIRRVIEQPQAASTEHLQQLAWMIGAWQDQSDEVAVRSRVEWALDRAFITRKFSVIVPGRREMKGIEYIAWDPERKEFHSWYFDSEGGYGGGSWRREGNVWIEQAAGMTPRGEMASATHIFTPKSANAFTWRSVNRQVGGEKQDDVPEVLIQRVTGELSEVAKGQL